MAAPLTAPTWARADDSLWRRCGDDVLVLRGDGSAVVALGHPGAELWQVLGSPSTSTRVRDALSALAVEVSPDDVEDLLDELHGLGVLDRSAG